MPPGTLPAGTSHRARGHTGRASDTHRLESNGHFTPWHSQRPSLCGVWVWVGGSSASAVPALPGSRAGDE